MARSVYTRARRAFLGTGFVRILQAALGFALSIVLTRALGIDAFGVYSFTLALLSLFALPASNGIAKIIVRETAQAAIADKWPRVRGVNAWGFGVSFAYWLLASAGFVAVVYFLLSDSDTESSWVRALAALSLLFGLIMIGITAGSLRGLKRTVLAVAMEGVVPALVLICLVLVFSLGVIEAFSATQALFLHAASLILVCLLTVLVLFRQLGRSGSPGQLEIENSKWMRAILPFAALSGMIVIVRQTDLIMMGFLTDNASVGAYRIAIQGGMLAGLGFQVASLVLEPYLAELSKNQGTQQMENFLRMSARLSFLTVLPAFLLFLFAGEWLLILFYGESYLSAYWPLVILTGGKIVSAFFGSMSTLMNMTGNERVTMRIFAFAMVLNVGFNSLLIPLFGGAGAALASSVTLLVWNVLLWREAEKILGIRRFSFLKVP